MRRTVSTWLDKRFGVLTCSVARAGRIYVPIISYDGKEVWSTTSYHQHQAIEAIDLFIASIEVVGPT